MQTLRDIHAGWAYFAISANGLVGVAALVAYKKPVLRGGWLWISVISAQGVMMVQVVLGVILQSGNDYKAPDFHIFYGILAFITVGLAYQYRFQMRGRRELIFGLVELFIMGLGIRAMLQT